MRKASAKIQIKSKKIVYFVPYLMNSKQCKCSNYSEMLDF